MPILVVAHHLQAAKFRMPLERLEVQDVAPTDHQVADDAVALAVQIAAVGDEQFVIAIVALRGPS